MATLKEVEEYYTFNDLCKLLACLNRKRYDTLKQIEANRNR